MTVLLFGIAIIGLLYLHFVPALRQWRKFKGKQAAEIDMGYVQAEDYLGRSFRHKARQWVDQLEKPGAGIEPDRKDGISLLSSLSLPAGARFGEVLMVTEDLAAGANARFTKEVYVRGNCRVGPSASLHAIAVDGNLKLESGCRVERWVDCREDVELGPGCQIHGRVTGRRIRLAPGTQAPSFWAGEIVTLAPAREQGGPAEFAASTRPAPERRITIAQGSERVMLEAAAAAGMDYRKLERQSDDTWVYQGSLAFEVPVDLRLRLIVNGSASFAAHSVLDDVKASGPIIVGEDSTCRGNLFCESDIEIGPNTVFQGLIHACGQVLLCQGARGSRTDEAVVIYAGQELRVEPNVVIKGKLAAGRQVLTLSEATRPSATVTPREDEDAVSLRMPA